MEGRVPKISVLVDVDARGEKQFYCLDVLPPYSDMQRILAVGVDRTNVSEIQLLEEGQGLDLLQEFSELGCHSSHVPFGRNAFTTCSFVVRYGPSIRSMQYGIAGNTAMRQSRIALGLPGRFTIKDFPRIPAT